jgi:hypothetical protein
VPIPEPTHDPTLAPSTFLAISVTNPHSGTFAYDLPIQVMWKTRGDEALADCTTVDVYLYQDPDMSGVHVAVATLKTGYPNDRSVVYPWTPSTTIDPDTGDAFGTNIVGLNYQIRVDCTLGDSDYSDYFNIALTSEPTHAPTALPSPQPTPEPTSEPSKVPTPPPSQLPTLIPSISKYPTPLPTNLPFPKPTVFPTMLPTPHPTSVPSIMPTPSPSEVPIPEPTPYPTSSPSHRPSSYPTGAPTSLPSSAPTKLPTPTPIPLPSTAPLPKPTLVPKPVPTSSPIPLPTPDPTFPPTTHTHQPSHSPTTVPSSPTQVPTHGPKHHSSSGSGAFGSSINMGSTSMIVVGLIGLIIVIAAIVLIYRSQTSERFEKGGRGFKGEFQADHDLFLSADPTVGLMGDEYTASPLMDPRLDDFTNGDGDGRNSFSVGAV